MPTVKQKQLITALGQKYYMFKNSEKLATFTDARLIALQQMNVSETFTQNHQTL